MPRHLYRYTQKHYEHFSVRLTERYGIEDLTFDEFNALNEQIDPQRSNFIGHKNYGVAWWYIRVRETPVVALFGGREKVFRTCFPIQVLAHALQGRARKMRSVGLREFDPFMERLYTDSELQAIVRRYPLPLRDIDEDETRL